jgi:hypothetical protein
MLTQAETIRMFRGKANKGKRAIGFRDRQPSNQYRTIRRPSANGNPLDLDREAFCRLLIFLYHPN